MRSLLTFLRMDGLQHYGHCLYFIMWRNREDIPIKMNGTPLVAGMWEYFQYSLQHTEVFIPDDKMDTGKPSLLESYKERTLAFFIFFHAFCYIDDFPVSINAGINGNKDGYISVLDSQIVFQVNDVYIM